MCWHPPSISRVTWIYAFELTLNFLCISFLFLFFSLFFLLLLQTLLLFLLLLFILVMFRAQLLLSERSTFLANQRRPRPLIVLVLNIILANNKSSFYFMQWKFRYGYKLLRKNENKKANIFTTLTTNKKIYI